MSSNFSLHLGGTRERIIVGSIIFLVVDSPTFILAILTNWAWRPGAVLALVDCGTTMFQVFGNILFAR